MFLLFSYKMWLGDWEFAIRLCWVSLRWRLVNLGEKWRICFLHASIPGKDKKVHAVPLLSMQPPQILPWTHIFCFAFYPIS